MQQITIEPAIYSGRLPLVEMVKWYSDGIKINCNGNTLHIPFVTQTDDSIATGKALAGIYKVDNQILTFRSQRFHEANLIIWKVSGSIIIEQQECRLDNTQISFLDQGYDCDYGTIYHREVSPQFHGKGVGSTLFDIVENHIRATGRNTADLITYEPKLFHKFLVKRGYGYRIGRNSKTTYEKALDDHQEKDEHNLNTHICFPIKYKQKECLLITERKRHDWSEHLR